MTDRKPTEAQLAWLEKLEREPAKYYRPRVGVWARDAGFSSAHWDGVRLHVSLTPLGRQVLAEAREEGR